MGQAGQSKKRRDHLERFFDSFTKKNPDELDLSEAKRFFAFILDLDYHRKKDQ